MSKDRSGSIPEEEEEKVLDRSEESKRDRHKIVKKSKRKKEESSSSKSDSSDSSESEDERRKRRSRRRSRNSRRRRRDSSESEDESSSYSDSRSDESDSGSESESEESEEDARRRRRRERRRKEREREDRERRRRREKERERKRKRKREKEEKRNAKKKTKKKKEKVLGKTGAVTDSWGKYGIIRETDMWNKRPEFTAWLSEVKKVNLESLANWEEKQMFKEFMEDHNTATFPSKKYYALDAYHRRKMEKEMKKGYKKVLKTERTVFNDEEQRRQELLREREKQKEEKVEALKLSMQSGMAQAMKEQARLREEMVYQYRLGNFEAAAAIQRRLDPDVAM